MVLKFRVGVAAAAIAIVQLAGCGGSDDGPKTERTTLLGPVVGAQEDGTFSWKGIPYAKAPVGDLRWKAPADAAAWTAPRDASAFGNACVQSGRLYGPGKNNRYDETIGATLGQTTGAEDCLYLNVWQPQAESATPRPVIVFIHGGSNITGYTADPMYHGAALAKSADAVVVTVNYRLGVFGFLSQPALQTGTADDNSGNFAILDLVKALKFVNANIKSFGGDPANVTVMGHSAGATNVLALLTSPQVVNANPALIHRAIPISGGISLTANLPPGTLPSLSSPAVARAQGNLLAASLVVADGVAADTAAATRYLAGRTPAQIADYLRSRSADAVLSAVRTSLAAAGASGSGPIPEGTVVPADPIGAIQAGNYRKVPVLVGNTRDEGKLFPTFMALAPAVGGVSGRLLSDATAFNMAFSYKPDAAPATTVEQWIPAVYLPADTPVTGFNARQTVLTAISFGANRDVTLNAFKSQQASVWAWQWDWDEEPAPFNTIFGAAHGFEMPFVFGNFGPSIFANFSNTTANRPGRVALSDAMMKSIGAFARNGDPNTTAVGTNWPAWPSKLIFDANLTSTTITVK